jgi:arginyl-tRNA synthetase
VVAEHPGIVDLPADERLEAFREAGYAVQLQEQQDQLEGFNTHFDVWFSERGLHADEAPADPSPTRLNSLRDQGHLFEADGALWMRTTDFGDDKDRVLIRSNGELTYFASDTAYYLNKRERGFDNCLYLLGADHHGYVGRLRAMAACVGDDPDQTLDVLIGQMVKILRDGEETEAVQARGHDRHARRTCRRDRRRCLALLPCALPGRQSADAGRRRDHQGVQRQPGLSTCSTPTRAPRR